MTDRIECENCKYEENCPVMWSYENAACLTIRKRKDEPEESIKKRVV